MKRRIFVVGNICALCEGTYPSSALYTCDICGRKYCGNCILFEDGRKICLRCHVRRLFNHSPRSKYAPLSILLAKLSRFRNQITLDFAKIEDVISGKLPESAYKYHRWWSNVRNREPSESWLTVGWRVKEVDLNEKKVTFVKEKEDSKKKTKSRAKRVKHKSLSPEFKALALKARFRRKRRQPSKTKIAILQARLKNIERVRKLRKHRKANPYEKKLYKEI